MNDKDFIIKQWNLEPLRANIFEARVKTAAKQGINKLANFYDGQIPAKVGSTPELYKSKLGTSVFSDLSISKVEYLDPQNTNKTFRTRGVGDENESNPLRVDTVLFQVNQTKNIITTAIQGRNGTVKEFISDGDYAISIRGVLTGNNGEYPKEAVSILYQLLKAPTALDVNSWFLSQFGIYQMVVTDYSFPQNEAMLNTQAFEITAISELPVELMIQK